MGAGSGGRKNFRSLHVRSIHTALDFLDSLEGTAEAQRNKRAAVRTAEDGKRGGWYCSIPPSPSLCPFFLFFLRPACPFGDDFARILLVVVVT